jgi:class 3 adenylate cyclase
MIACPNCGQENPEGFRLCGMCGTPLAAPERREERKVVTVLFADLVGFTSRAEQLDPEDVRAVLAPYHERLRTELERFGGTVEKFIGDAVMAIFGAPVAHEDDPERAVRAGLAIRDWAREEEIELRVGINTGEALVTYGAEPLAAGDVVNTAARLQAAAPVTGILVGEKTYEATKQAIDFGEAESVTAKGKADPVPVWEALQARSRFGIDVVVEVRAPLVGRDRELDTLQAALDRAIGEQTPQLVTLVGAPGIGKSRLVHELFRVLESGERPELIRWRQGRSLPYGEGVSFWALAEMVKAEAGVLEGDSLEAAAAKLARAVSAAISDDDAAWVERHLRPLVGAGGDGGTGERSESFAAWRRFVEALAEQRPTVLVFEDLQWADDALLDFVDDLVEWTRDVPLFVICTARPELLERRPSWGGGKADAATVSVRPLSDEQTATLIAKLLDRPVLAAETQTALLAHAGGNPLYAEQYARMLEERGAAEAVPETVQGIIAARLDALSAPEKSLLQDAAVLGKVFWAGAIGGSEDVLHGLERKEFVQRARRSSIAGETEYAFRHLLVRDVAYGQIPRPERARKHTRAAEWIETLGRPEDNAEMLAHHWGAALELARAAGQEEHDLVERTRLALRAAGDRAFSLHAFAAAERYYAEALALWPGDATRADLLFRWARALHVAADPKREQALEEARDALLAVGDRELAAEAQTFLAHAAWYGGSRNVADERIAYARELVKDSGDSPAKTRVLAFYARLRMLAGDDAEATKIAQEALALSEALDLPELRAHTLTTIGTTKGTLVPGAGIAELEQAVEIALGANSPTASPILNNLAVVTLFAGDSRRAGELWAEGLRVAERLGDGDGARFLRAQLLRSRYWLGNWDEALAEAERFIAECETSPHYLEGSVRRVRAAVRLARGDPDGAREDDARALTLAREAKDPQVLVPALAEGALHNARLGHDDEARRLAQEALDLGRAHPSIVALLVDTLAAVAGPLGVRGQLREVIALAPPGPWTKAMTSAAEGELGRAAELFTEIGSLTLAADVRFGAAEELLAAGRSAEAEAQLEQALAFFRSVGATYYEREGRALLAEAG